MKKITIILASVLLLTLSACQSREIKPMDRQEFWSIIDEARAKSGTDMERRYNIIKNRLSAYPLEDIEKFGQICGAYVYAAEENLLVWAACKVMEGYASDDTFLYFCCWLVSEGYDVYSAAVRDPETLASTADYEYRAFEMLMYLPYDVYIEKTGSEPEWNHSMSDDERQTLLSGIAFADDTPFRVDEEEAKSLIPQYLPRLIERFGYDHEKTMEEMRLMREDPEALMQQMKQELLDMGMSEEEYDRIMEMANRQMQ